jgi:hypothetical protein
MKILTATPARTPRDTDYCEAVAGEICVPHGLVCTTPEKVPQCGCDRTHIGVSSRQRTTTVTVSETEWTFDQLVAVSRDNLVESNWIEAFGEESLGEVGRGLIAQSVEVANDHALRAILRPRFDHATELWYYDDADD